MASWFQIRGQDVCEGGESICARLAQAGATAAGAAVARASAQATGPARWRARPALAGAAPARITRHGRRHRT